MRERLVVIGNGMAGIGCVEALLGLAPDRFDITVFSAEPHPNYNRIQLSHVLQGSATVDELVLNPLDWYARHGITLALGAAVTAIDRARRVVVAADGRETPYDKLLIATGSRAIVLPLPGRELDGVFVFRTVDDCARILAAARTARHAAVIGGGLLGLEAAYGLKGLGLEVTVVHLVDRLMERQLDATGGAYVRRALERQGIAVKLRAETREILGAAGRVAGLRFADGGELAAELVVMAAGIRPDSELARAAGLACGRGVVVDDWLRTSDPDIYAVGECAEHRGVAYGLVAPLYEQGRVAAAHLAGRATTSYAGSVVSTKLKVSGVDVFSAGEYEPDDGDAELLRAEDSAAGVYKKLVLRGGRLVGAVLVGDLSPAAEIERLLRSPEPTAEARALLFPPPVAASAPSPGAQVLALADDAVVCACNGVDKGTIVRAIRDGGCETRKQVAACTNASRSCGGCGPQVDALLALVHGKSVPAPARRSLCDCTELTRDEVVAQIRARHLVSVAETLRALGWRGDGCATCRPAVNYYLTMCWPGENRDDPRSRLVNERVHANIQRDGTYSVVPRMYGGVTTPEELIRIGEVARRFRVPTVKITGGQRIDLLGVEKEDLPAVWDALGMPSGYAYAKAIRTVKTCVGSTWCRYGTRDAMALGARIERTFETLWTPAKVKMAVNACPRNCAESLIKDVGLIAADRTWEIYVGGNGGVKVRQAELLCTVETDDQAIETIAAFIQLYREEASYGERTSHYLERVGLAEVRRRVVEDGEGRRGLVERMTRALAGRRDPWRERVEKLARGDEETAREYAPVSLPLKVVA